MAKWLGQESQGHEMYCHDLEVMDLNPGQVELGEHSTSAYFVLEQKMLSHPWNIQMVRLCILNSHGA